MTPMDDTPTRLRNYRQGDPPPCHPDAFWEAGQKLNDAIDDDSGRSMVIHEAVCSVCKRSLEQVRLLVNQ